MLSGRGSALRIRTTPPRRFAHWRRSFGDGGKRRWREEVPSSLRYAAVREVDGGGLLFAVVEVSEWKAVFAMPGDPASPVENRHIVAVTR